MGEFTNDVKLAATKQTKTIVIEIIDCNRCLFTALLAVLRYVHQYTCNSNLLPRQHKNINKIYFEAMDWAEELKMTIRKVKNKVKYTFLIENSYLAYCRLRHARAVGQRVEMC